MLTYAAYADVQMGGVKLSLYRMLTSAAYADVCCVC
jgi:hypothetical protein